jgi:hypothetical protein
MMDGILKIPLPQYLQEHKEEILHIFVSALGSDYKPGGWRNYFRGNPDVSKDLNIIIEKCPSTISRENVGCFASEVRCGGYEELRRLFLACMIWGWGRGGRYGEGFKNTEAALSDPRLREVLKETLDRTSSGNISEAYKEFKLAGCGCAFFTKFLYFVGREYDVKPLPLIRDRHVMNFLRFLSKQEQWDSSICTRILEKKEKGYIQYICSADDWAKELGCPADNIEYFMFKGGRELGKTATSETGKRNAKEARIGKSVTKKRAIEFSEYLGYTAEVRTIRKMQEPKAWARARQEWQRAKEKGEEPAEQVKGSPWWFNPRVIIGVNLLLWEKNGVRAYPLGTDPKQSWLRLWRKWARNYVKTAEGKAWYEDNDVYWM